MKKILKSCAIIIAILFFLSPICFGESNEVKFKDQIKKEDGSLFEKIIAECIGGIAQTVFDFTTGETANVGFKNYDELIFNNNTENDDLSPFTEELWKKTMDWYKIFAIISGSLILLAVFILAYKIIYAGMNTARKNEAKESLLRLCFGGVAIFLAPFFIRFLLFFNNGLVHLLVTASHGSLDGLLGNSMLTSIKTGNAIATALVIAMFIYLFVKLNIKFIVRQFTIIIFTIFTPVACGLWIINKNVTAASIWAGQIIMNIFMQFIYCFLFLIYLAFLPSGGGWAISLIWAMMILPIADALQNCLQNLTSRIAGIDNEQMANRVVGMGSMLGYGISAIREQFNSPTSNIKTENTNSNNNNNNSALKGFVTRAKNVINPSINLSDEKDYNGNINPIRNVIPKQKDNLTISKPTLTRENKEFTSNNENNYKSSIGKVAKTGLNVTKAYLDIGSRMVEGNYNKSLYDSRRKFDNTEYVNKINSDKAIKKIGDKNEPKG